MKVLSVQSIGIRSDGTTYDPKFVVYDEETTEILSDDKLMRRIRKSEADIKAGRFGDGETLRKARRKS